MFKAVLLRLRRSGVGEACLVSVKIFGLPKIYCAMSNLFIMLRGCSHIIVLHNLAELNCKI